MSRAGIVARIVRKDFTEFSRDRLYIFLSVLGLIFFVGIYYLVPDDVDETLTMGIHHSDLGQLVDQLPAGDEEIGLKLVEFDTEEALAAAVADSEIGIGMAFPEGFVADAAAGERPTVTVYADAAIPPEIRDATTSLVRELAHAVAGYALPVGGQGGQVLGVDRAGDQMSMRDALLPMLIFFVLMIETFALASLIANEVLNRTVTAVLVTPARLSDFLTAKTLYGALLTGGQAVVLLAALQAFTLANLAPLLVVIALGGLMFTGIAMISGSAGKDFFGTLFYNMALVLPLLIPTFSVLFPGTAAPWVQVMPSYPIIDSVQRVTSGAPWSEIAGSLGLAAAWVAVIYVVGLLVLRRKVRSL